MIHRRTAAGFVALLLCSASAAAADGKTFRKLDLAGMELSAVEGNLSRLESDYGSRRGLIGAAEARARFEEAVYRYLVGDHEAAAVDFYTLVESEALESPALAVDSQWYLARCLFELSNYGSAIDAFQHIVDQGANHPYFEDAVLGLLETYGLTRENDAFYDVYKRYVVSGRVKPSDLVKYTVAKSLYRQGENARAKAMLGELATDDPYFGKAHYFLGAILAAEGDLEAALAEFQKVETVAAGTDIEDLTYLALGRICYELGRFQEAADYYERISGESPFFADHLYELTWTYIKRERWADALAQVEVFLVGFPDHNHAVELRLLQGHLNMKVAVDESTSLNDRNKAYDSALDHYQSVVTDLAPFRDRLADIEADREDTASWFRRISASEAFDTKGDAIPAYAVEMLVDDQHMGRAVTAHRELTRQIDDVERSRAVATDVGVVLAASDPSIGTFDRGRAALARVRDDALKLQASLTRIEIDYLLAESPSAVVPEVRGLQARWEALDSRVADVQGEATTKTDLRQAYADQVREVQNVASKVAAENDAAKSKLVATRRYLVDGQGRLSADDAEMAQDTLQAVGAELDEISRQLDRVQGNATRRIVMQTVPSGGEETAGAQRQSLAQDFQDLRALAGRYRRSVDDPESPKVFGQLDEMWKRVSVIDGRALATNDQLDDAETRELAEMRVRLASEVSEISEVDRGISRTQDATEDLAVDITRDGVGRLEDELADTIMQADMGIVDVYWIKKTNATDEITRLAKERGVRGQELDDRYDMIRLKLDEQAKGDK